ncbi:MAG: PDZ domain-containing protein [Fibrobacterota bacterium]|nr:PDZ domain-containing protein [Fibrobacterota bacterium]QQS04614.1 MAG: PDZ domain-containing protein [Fibrobacterota bacterium]
MNLPTLALAFELFSAPSTVPPDSAKPSATLQRIATPWIGLRYQAPGPPGMQFIRMLNSEVDTAVAISEVVPKGPADLAGLKKHDLLVGFQGARVFGVVGFRNLLAKLNPGDSASFEVNRDGTRFRGTLVVGTLPEK